MTDYLSKEKIPLFIGQEHVNMVDPSFFKKPYVKRALWDKEDLAEKLNPFIINCVHGDHVSELPKMIIDENFTHNGSSARTPHELWTYAERILSMQPHPELNTYKI